MDGGGVLGSGGGELVKEREDQQAGVLMVSMRAKERTTGLYPVLSRVVARWQSAEPWGGAWHGEESSSTKAKER